MSTTLNTIDWNGLREEGLRHLQAMSGHLWTDYHIHDPGVTILELLCYAVTDLNGRLSQDIADILGENRREDMGEQFFSPREVLTINPVTINDYRKLLIDIPGVKNAWISPITESRPALYYDQDNGALLYDYVSGSQRITLNGLYRVYIEKDEDVTADHELKSAVVEKLHAHRNLCEDFVEVNIMDQETISIFSDIEIDENADPNEVMGKIYYDLETFISPRVKQYSLKRMLQKGKTIEEIFTGPQLENGFIDDDELGSGEKRKELHTSDLIRIIMTHPEVKDVRNLFITNKLEPEIGDKQEWALVVDDTKALVMEPFNGTKLRIFKKETMCPVGAPEVEAQVARLKKENSREIFDDPAMDLPETLGETSGGLLEYSPITYRLPAAYGVSETGLPSTVPEERRDQAKQLRAYLLFFEQILVNYLKQLDSFKHLFAFRQNRAEILKTYFTRLLPEELWKTDFSEIEEMITNDPTESLPYCESAFKRKNRILDHLLAQFNEKFSDYALFGFKHNMLEDLGPKQKETEYLKAKADFLENYPKLSRNRNRAYNYFRGGEHAHGLKKLIAAKLGIDLLTASAVEGGDSEEFFLVEHILFRPEGSLSLDFICNEKIAEAYQPDPYSNRLTFVLPKNAGRFRNSRFKELVYTTIANETPAHISYSVLEFNSEQMRVFTDTYHNFLLEVVNHKQGNSAQYNIYRNKLMELIGVGRPGLPVLHLDADDVFGDGSRPEHESPIPEWKDLSCNNHHALAETAETMPKYVQTTEDAPAFLRFTEETRLKIEDSPVHDDFSIVVVFKPVAQIGQEEEYFKLVAGVETSSDHFSLGFQGNGNVRADLDGETVILESEAGSPHLAIFTRDQTTGEIRLSLDGVLQTARQLTTNASLSYGEVVIGPGAVCDLGEVIILDSALTGAGKQKLEEHLSQKWRIPLSAVSSIAEPAFHLASDVSGSVIKDEKNNRISKWLDLSLEGMDTTQENAALQPVYYVDGMAGLPAIYFDNAGLIIPNAAQSFFQENFTIGLVYQAKSGEGRLLDGTATAKESDKKSFSIALGERGALEVRGETEELKLAATLEDTHLAVITGRVTDDRLQVTVWMDGKSYAVQEFTDARIFSDCPDNLVIGQSRLGGSGFAGKIGEIVIYNKALPVWERQRLEKFMAEKWGIDISGVERVAPTVLHLDGARLAGVLDESGAPADTGVKVYQWSDLGDSGNHAMQNNIYRRPEYIPAGINGLGAIKFTQEQLDETDFYEDSLNVERIIQSDFTMMMVFKPDAVFYEGQDIPVMISRDTSWTEGVAIIDADCSGRYNDFGLSFGKTGEKLVVMGGIGDRITQDHTVKSRELDFNSAHFITFTREKAGGEVKLYVDGLLHAQADLRDDVTLNDSRTIKIGAFNSEGLPFHGQIGEIVLFDRVLTERQRQRIEEYFSTKWRIPIVTLPVDPTGLVLHLDADASASIIRDADDRVSHWYDPDNSNNVAVIQLITEEQLTEESAVTEEQPVFMEESIISGRPAIHFNYSFMTVAPEITSYDDLTLAIVYNALSSGNITDGWDDAGLVDHYMPGETNNFGVTVTKNNTLRVRVGAQRIEAAASVNVPHIAIMSARRDQTGGEVKVYLDGLPAAAEACDPQISLGEINDFTIGAIRKLSGEQVSKGYFHGAIGELLMLNRVLTDEERQNLEDYFSLKWRIDISGVNSIAKPVLHLDAGKLTSVIADDTGRVSQWLDLNGSNNSAFQTDSARQPKYRYNSYNGLGALHFNGAEQNCLSIKPVVKDDFTVIIVYQAEEGDGNVYMPVARDSFTVISGVDLLLSETIWIQIKDRGYIDDHGNVLPEFAPREDGFALALDPTVLNPLQAVFAGGISAVLADYGNLRKTVPPDAFTGIGGVDQELSQTIWLRLLEEKYINEDGKVLEVDYAPQTNEFIKFVAESAIINVILAQNWLEGVGLFDGNCPGDRGQPNKRDFGLLVGKDGKLIAGIGVPDDQDYRIEQTASFGRLHIAVLTRVKATGVVRLYLDGIEPVEKRIAHNVSLKDSKQFTIGAVNTGGNYFTGDLAEIIVLDQVPTDNQLTTIQNFLAKKWGVVI